MTANNSANVGGIPLPLFPFPERIYIKWPYFLSGNGNNLPSPLIFSPGRKKNHSNPSIKYLKVMTQKNCLNLQKGLLKSVMVVHLLLPIILIGIVSSILGGITTEAANIKMAEQGNLQIVSPDSSSSSSSASFSSSSSSNEQETFLRRQRDLAKKVGSEGGGVAEGASCTIRVKKIDSLPGKCVKLKGGFSGCQNDRFLDPNNADCEDE